MKVGVQGLPIVLVCLALGACGRPSSEESAPSGESVPGDVSTSEGADPAQAPSPDGKALFAQHCAGCHGIKGDGSGETPTDRPPRDFAQGGFAFGNSREALFRTVSKGMPGRSDMQPFEDRLSEAERWAVVDHVLSLAPRRDQDWMAGAEMRVDGATRCVWGKIPSLGKGWRETPRGLVVGLPNGITLIWGREPAHRQAVLRGPFVKRTDWGGRGGQALELRGEVLFARPPRSTSPFLSGGKPLESRWKSAATPTPRGAVLRYELLARGKPVAAVTDSVTADGAGWRRTLTVRRAPGAPDDIAMLISGPGSSDASLQDGKVVLAWRERAALSVSMETGMFVETDEGIRVPVPPGDAGVISWRVRPVDAPHGVKEETR